MPAAYLKVADILNAHHVLMTEDTVEMAPDSHSYELVLFDW